MNLNRSGVTTCGEIFQRDAIDLASGVEGHGLKKHDLLWCLIADAGLGEFDQVERFGLGDARLERDIGADVLAMEEIVQPITPALSTS